MQRYSHDEINLVRLLRRIEISVANKKDWKQPEGRLDGELWLKAQKQLQFAKFARSLVKNIESNEDNPPPSRVKQFDEWRSSIDKIENFLETIEKPEPPKFKSALPIPKDPPAPLASQPSISVLTTFPPPYSQTPTDTRSALGKGNPGLLIDPPEPGEISPTIIATALPSLLPANPPATSTSSSFAKNFTSLPTLRKGSHTQGTTALQEELSSQMELMAQQLKRNALHFSSLLEKDKEAVEDAQLKIERNFDEMQKGRVRLRDHRGKSTSTTCMMIGIIFLVLLIFVLMIGLIRFS